MKIENSYDEDYQFQNEYISNNFEHRSVPIMMTFVFFGIIAAEAGM